jgi:hypothetical protein
MAGSRVVGGSGVYGAGRETTNPEARYQPVGSASAQAVRQMLAAARKLLEKL